VQCSVGLGQRSDHEYNQKANRVEKTDYVIEIVQSTRFLRGPVKRLQEGGISTSQSKRNYNEKL
jgi:hypothetical protein